MRIRVLAIHALTLSMLALGAAFMAIVLHF